MKLSKPQIEELRDYCQNPWDANKKQPEWFDPGTNYTLVLCEQLLDYVGQPIARIEFRGEAPCPTFPVDYNY